jgi:FtsP/CotA-like multicopper oxidase with cupredoxin domain
MALRDIYLKIEPVFDYHTVPWRRDCMRNAGHEDGTIPLSEVYARRMTALVYREYLDAAYQIPKPDKIVLADINEPPYHHRVPGTVIYAHPGDRLRIHVLNGDSSSHSLHVHGIAYGIDSDGAWPFGTTASDGRRSDEICTGQRWTYVFDVRDDMIGAWPFHDHAHRIADNANRGLFGGIVVLSKEHHAQLPPPMPLPDLVKRILDRPLPLQTLGVAHIAPTLADGMDGMPGMGSPPRVPPMEMSGDTELEDARMFLMEWAAVAYHHPQPEPHHTLHVPLFINYMVPQDRQPAFDKTPFRPGDPPFEVVFGGEGEFGYHCQRHAVMTGKVSVVAGAAPEEIVHLDDTGGVLAFNQAAVTVRPGGKVRWMPGTIEHTVTENGVGTPSFCLNGRTFIGNTPTIVAHTGQKIRWYVFNLDFGMNWHNFHPHGQRWHFANEAIDVRSLSPAESFVVETVAPPVLLLPPEIEKTQDPKHRPKDAKQYKLRGDFLVHCHVEMHMMQGLTGLVRSLQTVWLTPAQAKHLRDATGLPIDPGPANNDCAAVDLLRCEKLGCGRWEEIPGAPQVTAMHAMLIPNTNLALLFGYGDIRPDISRLYDYSSSPGNYLLPSNQPFDVTQPPHNQQLSDLWSAAHTALDDADGTLLIHGGFTPRETYRYRHQAAPTPSWSRTNPTAGDRFYATTLTLGNGRALTLFGNVNTIEVYDPLSGNWSVPKNLPASFGYRYYPWTYLLPDGRLFIAGHQQTSRRFDWTVNPIVDDPANTWMTNDGDRSSGAEHGTSVLLPLRPPTYAPRVLIAGGDPANPPTIDSAEQIDLSVTLPMWIHLPKLNTARTEQVNSVLLPDGRVMIVGGVFGTGGPVEIFDPRDPGAGWIQCALLKHPRGYHSTAILLADGSVLVGGDQPPCNLNRTGETTPNERYYPSYYDQPRPTITTAPASVIYGSTIAVQTPQASTIAEVVVVRPGAVTHGFNMAQRLVELVIASRSGNTLQVEVPANKDLVPPGYYLLFVVDGARVPSIAHWIRITP